MAYLAGGAAIAGVVANLYGANKQSQDNASALAENKAAQEKQNQAQWTNWLMTRGVAPTSPVETGVMPGAGQYTPVNTRLPIWATLGKTTVIPAAPGSSVPQFRRITAPSG